MVQTQDSSWVRSWKNTPDIKSLLHTRASILTDRRWFCEIRAPVAAKDRRAVNLVQSVEGKEVNEEVVQRNTDCPPSLFWFPSIALSVRFLSLYLWVGLNWRRRLHQRTFLCCELVVCFLTHEAYAHPVSWSYLLNPTSNALWFQTLSQFTHRAMINSPCLLTSMSHEAARVFVQTTFERKSPTSFAIDIWSIDLCMEFLYEFVRCTDVWAGIHETLNLGNSHPQAFGDTGSISSENYVSFLIPARLHPTDPRLPATQSQSSSKCTRNVWL